ncbi:MAG TPA: alanine racemase [Elusimicrobiota bacterium]|nr:alanine racemase [Elusimicrobiota bacterium]
MKPLRWVEVDLNAVGHNVKSVRRRIGKKTGFTAVVKTDAYGHGAVPVARAALRCGADGLAVTYLEEALPLRRAGIKAPVLVMGPVSPAAAPLVRRWNLSVMVDNEPLLKALKRAGTASHPIGVQVKVNLGLWRWGIPLPRLGFFCREVDAAPSLRLEGIFAHPGYMIGKNKSRIEDQLRNFVAAADACKNELRRSRPELHAADSAVLLDFPEFQLDRVRVGNLIYGINPTDKPLELRNPWRALSRLVRLERLAVGDMVGYGGEFVAPQAMTIATVPVGYGHGLTLEPASRWIQLKSGQNYWGKIRGIVCPFVGRVGMSHCLVDVSSVPAPKIGDVIQLPLRRTASLGWPKIYSSQ